MSNELTSPVTAESLKLALWETLNQVKSGHMDAGRADSIAAQAREILRTTNTQLRIAQQARRSVPDTVIGFGER